VLRQQCDLLFLDVDFGSLRLFAPPSEIRRQRCAAALRSILARCARVGLISSRRYRTARFVPKDAADVFLIDLFSSIGGFTLGVLQEERRLRGVGAIDLDAWALMIYAHLASAKAPSLTVLTRQRHYFSNSQATEIAADVKELVTALLRKSALKGKGPPHVHLHASPPCEYICGRCTQVTREHRALSYLLVEATCRAIELLYKEKEIRSFSLEDATSLVGVDAGGFAL